MSIEILLIPLALSALSAAVAAAQKSGEPGAPAAIAVETRMKDTTLLTRALQDTGATVSWADASRSALTASWQGVTAEFRRDARDVWAVHLHGDVDVASAQMIMQEVDRRYGLHVQQEVVRRIRERAHQSGMSLESETVEDDASVTLTLSVMR